MTGNVRSRPIWPISFRQSLVELHQPTDESMTDGVADVGNRLRHPYKRPSASMNRPASSYTSPSCSLRKSSSETSIRTSGPSASRLSDILDKLCCGYCRVSRAADMADFRSKSVIEGDGTGCNARLFHGKPSVDDYGIETAKHLTIR